jgi:hypothetical protein
VVFDAWSDLLDIMLMGLRAYPLFVVTLRGCGNHEFPPMNAFNCPTVLWSRFDG